MSSGLADASPCFLFGDGGNNEVQGILGAAHTVCCNDDLWAIARAGAKGSSVAGQTGEGQSAPETGDAQGGSRRAGATGVSDYYYATTPTVGGFHLANQTGRAIFRWASPSLNYDVTLTLSDDIAVGEDVGWTYSVDGMQFYLFFSKFTTLACGTDKWEIKGSYDNDTFFTFACAE